MLDRRIRVVLADDHPMILDGLRRLLEPNFEVVGALLDGRELVPAVLAFKPDLVITDISMPDFDGIEATRQLKAVCAGLPVIILSLHAEPYWLRAAFEAGADAYLTKASAPDEIGFAVREVLAGRQFVSSAATRALVVAAVDHPGARGTRAGFPTKASAEEPLTPREREVVHLLGKGLGNKDIAHQLGVSVTTVRTHLQKIYDKRQRVSRVELALRAAREQGQSRASA